MLHTQLESCSESPPGGTLSVLSLSPKVVPWESLLAWGAEAKKVFLVQITIS